MIGGMVLWMLVASGAAVWGAGDEGITWLLQFRGDAPPQEQGWTPIGGLAQSATVGNGVLRITDDSAEEEGCFRAPWKPDPARETIVEARVRVVSVKAFKGGTSIWPWRDGTPVGLLVSDGRRQGGLSLCPEKIATFLDRFALMDTTRAFHTYRLVIRGEDMSVWVDDELKIRGEGAFYKAADTPEAFVQFGSNSKAWTGEAFWQSVRLGIRKVEAPPRRERLRITISEPWDIPPAPGTRHTRPYLYNVGGGILLMSVAQGPDAYYEPYGILKSTDEGKTWTPVTGLQQKMFAPLPMIRLAGGDILGVSRWVVKYAREPGIYVGMGCRFDPNAERFALFENRILAPKDMGDIIVFDRHLFDIGGGVLLASVYGRPQTGGRRAFLMKSEDEGQTWTHFSTVGEGAEPSYARLSETEMTAILRDSGCRPFWQTWSHDGGRTWEPFVRLEEGSVDADLEPMSNGVLACSYGRPGSCLMFSTDGGRTWGHHRVITDEKGFNYTSIREVRPGRLLYVHDAPRLRACTVDVERVE